MIQSMYNFLQDTMKSASLILILSLYAGPMLARNLTYSTGMLELIMHVSMTVMFIIAGFIIRQMLVNELKHTVK